MIDDILRLAHNEKNDDRQVEIMMATHSPYIVNYMNVVLYQNKTKRAKINSEDLAVYRLFDGEIQNLMVKTKDKSTIVDTSDMTEQMQDIMSEYKTLRNC